MQSRLIPFTIAGAICFALSFILGAGFWYFFGTKRHQALGNMTIVQPANQNSAETNTNIVNANAANPNANTNSAPSPTPEIKLAPAGEIKIAGGIVTLGGGDTNLPVIRVDVADFAIGETAVTNAQYAEFVKATSRKTPASWKDGSFPAGTDNEPVVGVTWADANDYCQWLSKEIGATVRLPSEAEWERAARGDTGNKYPWGGEWSDEAAQGKTVKGKIFAVKSLPAGRSPFGVYEMVGNVWQWTSDLAVDEFQKPILFEKSKQRIIKGGSVKESQLKGDERDKYLAIDAHLNRPEDKASELLGFRYVVIRK